MALPTTKDLIKPPSIFDQYFIVSSINSDITRNGWMQFAFVPPTATNNLKKGYIYLNQEELVKVIEFEVGPFYLPKLPTWNIEYIAYKNRVCLSFSPLDRYGFTDYRLYRGNLSTNNFAFEFELTDVGDRWLLKPTGTGLGMILRTPINIPSGMANIRFSTTLFDLPLVSPYFDTSYLGDATAFGFGAASSLFMITNPGTLNYFTNNFVVFNTPDIPGVNYDTVYKITTVINLPPTPPTYPNGLTAIVIDGLIILPAQIGSKYNICNLSLEVRIPFRVRQLQEFKETSNRITPSSL